MQLANTLTALFFVVAGVTSATSHAQADPWIFRDNFNRTDPGAEWFLDDFFGAGYSYFAGPEAFRYAVMTMYPSPSSEWIGLGRDVDLSALFHPGAPSYSCHAYLYIVTIGTTLGHLEVIDNASWTYRSLVNFSTSGAMALTIQTRPWTPTSSVYVRMVLAGNGRVQGFSMMDDLAIVCYPQ